ADGYYSQFPVVDLLTIPPRPTPTLFPYTTLFRSHDAREDRRRDDGAVDGVTARLPDAVAHQSLGEHDREHDDRHHAARVEQELDGEEERLLEQEEDHAGQDERGRQVQHGVEQVGGEDDGETRGQQQGGDHPEPHRLERHAAGSFASPLASALAAVRAGFGGACMSRSRLPVAHDGSNESPRAWSLSLSSRRSRRSAAARSNDFIMTIASVGHTCTH